MFPLKIDRYLFSKKNIKYLKNVMQKNDAKIYLRISTGGILSVGLIPEYVNTSKLKSKTCLNNNLEILMTLENR